MGFYCLTSLSVFPLIFGGVVGAVAQTFGLSFDGLSPFRRGRRSPSLHIVATPKVVLPRQSPVLTALIPALGKFDKGLECISYAFIISVARWRHLLVKKKSVIKLTVHII